MIWGVIFLIDMPLKQFFLFKIYIPFFSASPVDILFLPLPGGVAGTPWHFVNGVELSQNADSLSLEDYRAIIDPLLRKNDVSPVLSFLVSLFPKTIPCSQSKTSHYSKD